MGLIQIYFDMIGNLLGPNPRLDWKKTLDATLPAEFGWAGLLPVLAAGQLEGGKGP